MTINYRDAKFDDIKGCTSYDMEYTVTSVFCSKKSTEDNFTLPFFIVNDKYLFGIDILEQPDYRELGFCPLEFNTEAEFNAHVESIKDALKVGAKPFTEDFSDDLELDLLFNRSSSMMPLSNYRKLKQLILDDAENIALRMMHVTLYHKYNNTLATTHISRVSPEVIWERDIADKTNRQHYRTAWLMVEEIFVDPIAPILRLSGMDGYVDANYFIGLDLFNNGTELRFGILDDDFADEDAMVRYYKKIENIHDKITAGNLGVSIPKDFGIIEAVEDIACNRDQLLNIVRHDMTGWM